MSEQLLLQLVLSGLGMGFIFALIAIGLTLIYGVMDVVNFAHGEFLMIAMYASYLSWRTWGLDPLVTLPFVALAMFVFGVLRLLRADPPRDGREDERADLRDLRPDGVPPGRSPSS